MNNLRTIQAKIKSIRDEAKKKMARPDLTNHDVITIVYRSIQQFDELLAELNLIHETIDIGKPMTDDVRRVKLEIADYSNEVYQSKKRFSEILEELTCPD